VFVLNEILDVHFQNEAEHENYKRKIQNRCYTSR
jgi:hypothetical protein